MFFDVNIQILLLYMFSTELYLFTDLQNRRNQLQNDIQLLYLPLKYDLKLIRDAAQHAAVVCELVSVYFCLHIHQN